MGDTPTFADAGYRSLWIAHWTTASTPTVPASQLGRQRLDVLAVHLGRDGARHHRPGRPRPVPVRRLLAGPHPARPRGRDGARRAAAASPRLLATWMRAARAATADDDDRHRRTTRARPERARRPRPRVGDRRGRGGRRPVRRPAGDLRRLHGLGAEPLVHRGLHPRRGPAAVRQHPHGVVGDGPPDDALPRGGAAASCSRASAATARGTPSIFCGSGLDRRDQPARGRPQPAHPGRPRRPLGPPLADPAGQRPVVFIGPYEHHSNELPWRESIADMVTIREDRDGYIDLDQLARRARALRRPAAEDRVVLGRLERDRHRQQHVRHLAPAPRARRAVVLRLRGRRAVRRDRDGPARRPARATRTRCSSAPTSSSAGPGRPGVLVARRELFTNRVPEMPGGGTVQYVNPFEHVYLSDIEHREEGGTPAIVESIRAGLVFQLKAAVGVEAIREREHDFIRRAMPAGRPTRRSRSSAAPTPSGCRSCRSSSATTAATSTTTSSSPLLNDLFGIQSRGGCSCAGPYGHRLLGIDLETSPRVRARDRAWLRGDQARLGPGQLQLLHQRGRVRVPARRGRPRGERRAGGSCPTTRSSPATGLWRHRAGRPEPPASLRDVRYDDGRMAWPSHRHREPESRLAEYLDGGARAARAGRRRADGAVARRGEVGPDFEDAALVLAPRGGGGGGRPRRVR